MSAEIIPVSLMGHAATNNLYVHVSSPLVCTCSPRPVVTGAVARARVVGERTVRDGRRFSGFEA